MMRPVIHAKPVMIISTGTLIQTALQNQIDLYLLKVLLIASEVLI